MAIGLERRLRKLEKTVRVQEDEIDQGAWRENAGKLRTTPESRAALRAYCQRMFRSMRLQKRKRIEVMSSPEQLERFRNQWTEEDARWEALRKRKAEMFKEL